MADAVTDSIPEASVRSRQALPDRREKRERQRETNRARNRLLSIHHDVNFFLKPLIRKAKSGSQVMKSWPLVANVRCGSWYTGTLTTSTCYFKSGDGHVGTWRFSLKRLNLPLVECVTKSGGCWIVDASRTKLLPDSLSRTIPIWACCLNRIVARFRKERGVQTPAIISKSWDEGLYTPGLISSEEHDTILGLLDTRVEELYSSKVILYPDELIARLSKPLRPFFITDSSPSASDLDKLESLAEDYFVLVCIGCCCVENVSEKDLGFLYSQGSADDEESWSRGLTPQLFWTHHKAILKKGLSNDETDAIIDEVVRAGQMEEETKSCQESCHSNTLGLTGISLGTRRAGRPPLCWESYDAVLNVSTTEYAEFESEKGVPDGKYYMQLPVEEGKRDKTELERWTAVGIVFTVYHLVLGRKVLIHCAQGRDRSAAIAIAVVVLFCHGSTGDLKLKPNIDSITDLVHRCASKPEDLTMPYKFSGLPTVCVVALQGRTGRDVFIEWFRESFPDGTKDSAIANKETLRIALHAIQRYRAVASPSRSTMQKLNRFFMSGSYTKGRET